MGIFSYYKDCSFCILEQIHDEEPSTSTGLHRILFRPEVQGPCSFPHCNTGHGEGARVLHYHVTFRVAHKEVSRGGNGNYFLETDKYNVSLSQSDLKKFVELFKNILYIDFSREEDRLCRVLQSLIQNHWNIQEALQAAREEEHLNLYNGRPVLHNFHPRKFFTQSPFVTTQKMKQWFFHTIQEFSMKSAIKKENDRVHEGIIFCYINPRIWHCYGCDSKTEIYDEFVNDHFHMVFDVVYDGLMEIDNWLEVSSKHIAAGKEGPLDGFGGRYPLHSLKPMIGFAAPEAKVLLSQPDVKMMEDLFHLSCRNTYFLDDELEDLFQDLPYRFNLQILNSISIKEKVEELRIKYGPPHDEFPIVHSYNRMKKCVQKVVEDGIQALLLEEAEHLPNTECDVPNLNHQDCDIESIDRVAPASLRSPAISEVTIEKDQHVYQLIGKVHADAMDLETQYMEVEALSEAKSPGTASNFSEELGDPEFIEMQHAAKQKNQDEIEKPIGHEVTVTVDEVQVKQVIQSFPITKVAKVELHINIPPQKTSEKPILEARTSDIYGMTKLPGNTETAMQFTLQAPTLIAQLETSERQVQSATSNFSQKLHTAVALTVHVASQIAREKHTDQDEDNMNLVNQKTEFSEQMQLESDKLAHEMIKTGKFEKEVIKEKIVKEVIEMKHLVKEVTEKEQQSIKIAEKKRQEPDHLVKKITANDNPIKETEEEKLLAKGAVEKERLNKEQLEREKLDKKIIEKDRLSKVPAENNFFEMDVAKKIHNVEAKEEALKLVSETERVEREELIMMVKTGKVFAKSTDPEEFKLPTKKVHIVTSEIQTKGWFSHPEFSNFTNPQEEPEDQSLQALFDEEERQNTATAQAMVSSPSQDIMDCSELFNTTKMPSPVYCFLEDREAAHNENTDSLGVIRDYAGNEIFHDDFLWNQPSTSAPNEIAIATQPENDLRTIESEINNNLELVGLMTEEISAIDNSNAQQSTHDHNVTSPGFNVSFPILSLAHNKEDVENNQLDQENIKDFSISTTSDQSFDEHRQELTSTQKEKAYFDPKHLVHTVNVNKNKEEAKKGVLNQEENSCSKGVRLQSMPENDYWDEVTTSALQNTYSLSQPLQPENSGSSDNFEKYCSSQHLSKNDDKRIPTIARLNAGQKSKDEQNYYEQEQSSSSDELTTINSTSPLFSTDSMKIRLRKNKANTANSRRKSIVQLNLDDEDKEDFQEGEREEKSLNMSSTKELHSSSVTKKNSENQEFSHSSPKSDKSGLILEKLVNSSAGNDNDNNKNDFDMELKRIKINDYKPPSANQTESSSSDTVSQSPPASSRPLSPERGCLPLISSLAKTDKPLVTELITEHFQLQKRKIRAIPLLECQMADGSHSVRNELGSTAYCEKQQLSIRQDDKTIMSNSCIQKEILDQPASRCQINNLIPNASSQGSDIPVDPVHQKTMREKFQCRSHYVLADDKASEGGYGTITFGRHKKTNFPTAIKCYVKSSDARKQYLQEAKILLCTNGLFHPNIIRALNFDPVDKIIYLEWIHGMSLHNYMKQNWRGLPEKTTREIFPGIVSGVDFLHKMDIIHRDLNDANIMLELKGRQVKRVVIIDFGQSDFASNVDKYYMKAVLPYAAPETIPKAMGKEKFEVDMWSLGSLAFFMRHGHTITRKFEADHKNFKKDDIKLAKIWKQFLMKNPKNFLPNMDRGSIGKIYGQLLQVDPNSRMAMHELIQTEFVASGRLREAVKIPGNLSAVSMEYTEEYARGNMTLIRGLRDANCKISGEPLGEHDCPICVNPRSTSCPTHDEPYLNIVFEKEKVRQKIILDISVDREDGENKTNCQEKQNQFEAEIIPLFGDFEVGAVSTVKPPGFFSQKYGARKIPLLVKSFKELKDSQIKFHNELLAHNGIGKLHCSSVLRLIYFDEPTLQLVYEFTSGYSIAQLVANNGPLSLDDCRQIVIKLVSGLAYIHKCDIIHGCLDDNSVIVNMEQKLVKIINFTNCTRISECKLWNQAIPYASVGFTAPEIDFWSLGALLYKMRTGETWYKKVTQDGKDDDSKQIMEFIKRNGMRQLFKTDCPALGLAKKLLDGDTATRASFLECQNDPWLQSVTWEEPKKINLSAMEQPFENRTFFEDNMELILSYKGEFLGAALSSGQAMDKRHELHKNSEKQKPYKTSQSQHEKLCLFSQSKEPHRPQQYSPSRKSLREASPVSPICPVPPPPPKLQQQSFQQLHSHRQLQSELLLPLKSIVIEQFLTKSTDCIHQPLEQQAPFPIPIMLPTDKAALMDFLSRPPPMLPNSKPSLEPIQSALRSTQSITWNPGPSVSMQKTSTHLLSVQQTDEPPKSEERKVRKRRWDVPPDKEMGLVSQPSYNSISQQLGHPLHQAPLISGPRDQQFLPFLSHTLPQTLQGNPLGILPMHLPFPIPRQGYEPPSLAREYQQEPQKPRAHINQEDQEGKHPFRQEDRSRYRSRNFYNRQMCSRSPSAQEYKRRREY